MIEETGAREELISELENFGIVQPEKRDGKTVYDETDREIVRAANELSTGRGRGAQSARLPLLRRPRGQPARSAAGTLAALSQSGAAQGGAGEPRKPGGDGQPPQAPAAGPRSAPPRGRVELEPMSRVVRRRTIAAPVDEVWSLVSDPYSLPRWWPRTTRVENVERKSGGRRSQWTKVLETNEGRGVRADFRCLSSAEPERYVWEQQLEGTPFARHLRSAGVEIGLRPGGAETQGQPYLQADAAGAVAARLAADAARPGGDP